jgi:hypothetical protein
MLKADLPDSSRGRAPGRLSRELLRLLMRQATIAASESLSDEFRLITFAGAAACRHCMDARTEDPDRDGFGVRQPNLHANRLGSLCRTRPDTSIRARRWAGKCLGSRVRGRRRMSHFRSPSVVGRQPPDRPARHFWRRDIDRSRLRARTNGCVLSTSTGTTS